MNAAPSRAGILEAGIRDLYPGYFSLVMATGIVSIACYRLKMDAIAWAMFGLNVIAYGILWLLLSARLVRYFPRVLADLGSHTRGPGFFTLIAGTCVLGSQIIILSGEAGIAEALWYLGIGLWLIVMYSFFTAVMVRENKPTLEQGINGAWLIATVATQSIAVLGGLLSSHFTGGRELALFFSLVMYFIGCMLYLSIITLIFYRFTFLKLSSAEVTPPYWINMGAVAITTLAGATLILNASQWAFLQELTVFLKGFTLFFWSAGTWWIPILFILGAWRHVYKHYPLRYDPQFWGMVFPLGMYTTCTFQFARALEIDFLYVIPRYFIYIALTAWVFTFAGLLYSLYSQLAPGRVRQVKVREAP